jgi:DNA-directed RNA polymerase specialized sigma24 family protein
MNASFIQTEALRPERFPGQLSECVDLGGIALITDKTWSVVTKKLLGFAEIRLQRHGSYASRYTNRAADYVQEAVVRLMDGTRHVSAGDENDLYHGLCSIVDSLISHDAEKANRRGVHMMITNDEASHDEVVEEHLSSGEDFETQVLMRNELEHFIASLEPDLEEYVRLRAGGQFETAEEYAAELGTTVAHIRNMDRRLRRRRDRW